MVAVYGVQADLVSIAHGGPLAMKACHTLSLAAIAGSTLMRCSGPEPRAGSGNLFAFRASARWARRIADATTSDADPVSLWLGSSGSDAAPYRDPVGAHIRGRMLGDPSTGAFASGSTGALAGLVSGGIAATMYAFACKENGAGFVLVWYTLGNRNQRGRRCNNRPARLRW